MSRPGASLNLVAFSAVLLLAPLSAAHAIGSDAQWSTAFDANHSPAGIVEALVRYDDTIVAGGWFTQAGGQSANYIARWNGTNWAPLGSGFNDSVYDLVVYQGDLIAAGAFVSSGSTSVPGIARWDGANWQPMGTGLNALVTSLAVNGGVLYAGGYFIEGGPTGYRHLAAWNGTSWTPVGLEGPNEAVWDMEVWNGRLVVGGPFTLIDGLPRAGVAILDGQTWLDLDGGVNNYVHSLATFHGDLIVGGRFSDAGPIAANSVARWDGSNWSAMGSGLNGRPYALESFGDDYLIAGGVFTTAGGVNAPHVAAWNGAQWGSLGSGVDDNVSEILPLWPQLFVGGRFLHAGTHNSEFIARWDALSPSAIADTPGERLTLIAAPNPAAGQTWLRWVGNIGSTGTISIWDVNGREVRRMNVDATTSPEAGVLWNGQDQQGREVPGGIYWVTPSSDRRAESARIVLLK